MNMMAKEPRAIYAQSSDIKSRTYLEYRHDMKKKAIAELEVIDWFTAKLMELHRTRNVLVKKSGGDAHLWFATRGIRGTVSGEPDYEATIDGKELKFEFQYSERDDLSHFDFKVSKVGKKKQGKRIPHKDREFLYIVKPGARFGILSTEWIASHGQEAGVPAWGNRTAFRVPREIFLTALKADGDLIRILESIQIKNDLLEFQKTFLSREMEKISRALQKVVDEKEILKIVPKTLEGFFQTCLLIDRLGKSPENANLWLVYLTTYFSNSLNSLDMAKFVYSMDFLWKNTNLEDNEYANAENALHNIRSYVKDSYRGERFETSPNLSPKNEARNFLFIINLIEDMTQEAVHYYGLDLNPVEKIFELLEDPKAIHDICSTNQ